MQRINPKLSVRVVETVGVDMSGAPGELRAAGPLVRTCGG